MRRGRPFLAMLGLCLTLAPATATASECQDAAPPPEPRVGRGGAAALAVVPGALAHGAGHFARGHDDTALTLLWIEGAGVGAVLASGTALVLTGASRYVVGPAALGVIGGMGLFTTSFLADVYGVAAPPCGFGRTTSRLPQVEATTGYRYVFDPQFSHRHFFVTDVNARFGRLRLSPSGWFSPDTATERLRLPLAVRLLGRLPGERVTDASHLEVTTALTHHEVDEYGFRISTLETTVDGRLDLRHLGPTLRGAFTEAQAGLASAHTAYDGAIPGDHDLLLLARFAFGVYLGRGRGEARLYYDHRHDGYAAGAIIPGLGSGVAGHFGMDAFYYLTDAWGLGGEAMLGAAYVAGLSARFRR